MVGRRSGVRGVAAATAIVFIAGVVTVVARGGDRHHQAAPPPPSTTSTSTTSTTVIAGDSDVTGEVQAPATGLYRYHETAANPAVAASEWAEQISLDDRRDVAITTTRGVKQTVSFTPAAEVELAFSQVGDTVENEMTCTESIPRLLLALPLRAAATWTSDAACQNLLGDQVLDHRVTTVAGRTTQPVAGQPVPVWELVTVETITVQPPTTTVVPAPRTLTTTADVSARYGLVVRELIQQGSDPKTLVTDRLVSLSPA